MKNALLTFFFISFTVLQAQSSFVESITIEQGLSQGFVPSITQDDDGFLWFGTKNGLNRYDGYDFKVFRNDPFDPHSLNNDEIISVKAMGDFLFLLTNTTKPMLFHRHTQQFFEIDRLRGINSGEMSIFETAGKNSVIYQYRNADTSKFYILSWPENLDELIGAHTDTFDLEDFITIEQRSIPEKFRYLSVSLDGQDLWFVSGQSILVQNISNEERVLFDLPAGREGIFSKILHNEMMVFDFGDKTWIISPIGIITIENGLSGYYPFSEEPSPFFSFDSINGILWIAGSRLVYGLDLKAEKLSTLPVIKFETDQLIRSVFSDQTGILWIGTDAFGVRKFNPRSVAFKNYAQGISIACKPLTVGSKYILLSDVRHGDVMSLLINEETSQIEDITGRMKGDYIGTNIPATYNDMFWWIEYFGNEDPPLLVKFNPETFERKTIELPDSVAGSVFALWADDADDMVWMLSNNKIISYNTKTQSLNIWKVNDDPMIWPNAIERDLQGNFWIGTKDKGIIQMIFEEGTWRSEMITVEKQTPNSLPTNAIKSLLFDPADPDILWIGTNGKGLCRYDTQHKSYEFFNVANGTLPDDVVYGILADDEQPRNLWLSTNKGLTRFNPESGFLQHFTRADGLQENEFNTVAAGKSPDGRLLFGGINGLTVFDPGGLIVDKQPPKLWFTDIKINGMDVNPGDSAGVLQSDIAYSEKIELPHDKNNLLFGFALMDFASPKRNSFTYYLEGAEEPWIHNGFDRLAQYLNLSPGKYTFWVKGVSSSGIHTEEPISLDIRILAPWYLKWPSLVVYGILFILAGFLFNQYQLQQRLKTAEAKRLKNLDQFKNRFYTNITHEFRTPLTVILGIADQMINKSKEYSHPLTLIKRNGENLLRLINQILDLTKLETQELKINYVQGDVLAFLKYISESLHSLANAQNVMLKVESSQASIIMDYDPERLMQIIHNLLSNAIKFTPSGGRVTMHVNLEGRKLNIAVADTGIGIPKEDLPYLFDRFFQAGIHGTEANRKMLDKAGKIGGSGIGLSLTKELVHIMGGNIAVESPHPDGKSGAVFTVTLPVTNNAALEGEQKRAELAANSLPTKELVSAPETDLKILLIEDNPDVMEYLASCLGESYHLDFAYNGRVGMETALETIPDLIISDVMMPEKDGLEVCDFLKNDQRTSHIPIILLTAKVTLESRLAGLRRGADVYLNKPFHEEELLVWIEQLIARQQRLKMRYANLKIHESEAPAETGPEALTLEDAFVRKFKELLEENYADPEFSVDDITEKMGMSRAQLYRKLKSLTGKTVSDHLNTIRLEKSKTLLREGKLNVSEVAYRVGYNDPKYFSRLFTESFGQSPGEFAGKT